ncbi:MAG: FAD-dependent oxidoreductase, partial [Pseudomonadota bacterium]
AAFGVRCGDHGRITDPGRYVKDLATSFEAGGGTVLRASVQDVLRDESGVTGIVTDVGQVHCDRLVVTAGVWSKGLASKLGIKTPLETERGYHIELYDPSLTPRAPTMIASGKFVLTPMEGRLRVAGLVEFGGLEAPPNAARSDMLLRAVRRAFPTLTFGETKTWMGHRPAPPDSIPYLGAVSSVSGAFVGYGHHHVGLTSGPRTGRVLANLIAGRTPNFDLAPYAAERFS